MTDDTQLLYEYNVQIILCAYFYIKTKYWNWTVFAIGVAIFKKKKTEELSRLMDST